MPRREIQAATEHTIAMMLALARNTPGPSRLADGRWDRKRIRALELRDKVLGVVGLGKIGGGVAKRALAMR